MKPKFGSLTIGYIKFIIKRELNSNWEISLTSRGNIKINDPDADEYFVISKYKDKYYIRRYADYLDRCYLICPSHYEKHTAYGYGTYTYKYFDYENYNDALNAFIKFIEKNRS